MLSRRLLLSAAAALALSAPGGGYAADPIPVVASFSILGDLVRQIAGPDATVKTLVGPDGDAHVYQPTPSDAKAVAAAKLVFMNGLGFEGWMNRLLKSSGTKATAVTVTTGIQPRAAEKDAHGHAHGNVDPHAWQNVAHVQVMVTNIAAALAAADPARAEGYKSRATAYQADLTALDADIRRQIGALSPAQRRVITSHDAFGYYGAAYGITFLAPQGMNTESEASAKDVAKLITQMRQQKIKAVFVENISDPRLTAQLAKEAGATVGGELYSDALSPAGGPATYYLDLMRANTKALVAAMALN
ncbi:metal ABC transporter solute-binding protein, Zn/Mn family [Elstera cyanobacteriorum]|uniref:metal ABC transporter solute-binding protein, Zn/Mn family n=1 Tax=Elstera cyanobacteriorum TaxID=2022747 RepID=UPI002355F775|nr:zinc ABC transporter substrate-binding protein [Elstera cyanobacteriorum]MCK6444522.1 zinc ABC transporter substrate-binding protein [Elstera cyanobacteriorum]